MKTFSALCVSGRSDLEPRDATAYHEFYEFVFRCVSKGTKSIDHTIEEPIYLTRRQRTFVPVMADVIDQCFRTKDLVIFDFFNFGNQYDLSYPIIEEILEFSDNHPETHVVLILKFLPKTDHIFDSIDHKIRNRTFHVIDRQGRMQSDLVAKDEMNSVGYVRLAEGLLEDHENRIRTRTIRHVGHYKRYSGDEPLACSQFFFDGSQVVNELASVVSEMFADEYLNARIRTVITVAPDGNWLHLVGEALGNVFERGHVSTFNTDHFQELSSVTTAGSLILFAMCDSGQTILDFLDALPPNQAADDDTLFASIFATSGNNHFEGERYIQRSSGSQICVKYVLRVRQKSRRPKECRMCNSGVPDYLATHDDRESLAPEEFWIMAFEAGFVVEKDVPDYRRPSLGFVPNFEQMSINNGPFMAHRIIKKLSEIPGKLPPEPIILCPDESGAIELARSLSRLGGWNVISVPRSIIQMFEIGVFSNDDLNAGDFADDYWFKKLFGLSQNPIGVKPIIFDEFDVSGSTLSGLHNLLRSLDMLAWCGLSFVSFRGNPRNFDDIEVYNCYKIGAA